MSLRGIYVSGQIFYFQFDTSIKMLTYRGKQR